ncbi:MAG: divergent PAP2 family protein [Vulcanibacillus sp.]
MALFNNYPLISAMAAMFFAQLLKFPVNAIINRKIEPMIIFSNGGMPSSHSAFVSALTVAIGIQYGVGTTYFAISFVFAAITMWDAAGIRYQASKHAQVLNVLIKDFQLLIEQVKYKSSNPKEFSGSPLKELLGHKPFEVFIGSIFGLLIAFIVKALY